jgi:hypothetical protein
MVSSLLVIDVGTVGERFAVAMGIARNAIDNVTVTFLVSAVCDTDDLFPDQRMTADRILIWLQRLRDHLDTLKPSDYVVKPTAKYPTQDARLRAVLDALKRVDANLTTRGTRRGALQAMAMGATTGEKVPLETLMRYAGHLNPATTRRYLDWSRLFGQSADDMRRAAQQLQH